MHFRGIRLFFVSAVCLCAAALPTSATAQTFTTIINVPPDPDPGSIGSDTQLNLFDGGLLGLNFLAGASDGTSTNVEANIQGGVVLDDFKALGGSTINITGGSVGDQFNAFPGSTVNINGGTIGNRFVLNNSVSSITSVVVNMTDGSVGNGFSIRRSNILNMSGGSIGDSFSAFDASVNISSGRFGLGFEVVGGTANISGGTFGDFFEARSGVALNLSGSAFQLDGVAIPGLGTVGDVKTLNLPNGSVLTGIFADGSAFVFSSLDDDNITDGTLTLSTVSLPSAPNIINSPTDPIPLGLHPSQMLNLDAGAEIVDNFSAVGATLNINGGTAGVNLELSDTTLNIANGSVGRSLEAFAGSTVNVNGGTVGRFFEAYPGSSININGGQVGDDFEAHPGSVITITGGSVGRDFIADTGSDVVISGGAMSNGFVAWPGSTISFQGGSIGDGILIGNGSSLNIVGGDFKLDGVEISGLGSIGDAIGFNLPHRSILTGTLADGSVLVLSSLNSDIFGVNPVTLTMVAVPVAGPTVINLPGDPAPTGLRAGQTLNLNGSGQLGNNFNAVSAIMNINDGTVGDNLDAVNSAININGGSIGNFFQAFDGSDVIINSGSIGDESEALPGSTLLMTGGTVGKFFFAHPGSSITIRGGSLGDRSQALEGSTINIEGGSIGSLFRAFADSTINISGGIFPDSLLAHSGSNVNLFGTSFILDGVDLTQTLLLGIPITITQRDVVLEGQFQDGSPFSFGLNSFLSRKPGLFDPNATLTITLVPEPSTLGLIGIGALYTLRRRQMS